MMGIEKLVPTMADLDRFLEAARALRHRTEIDAYTTLIRGPRRSGDECGPDEVHVVLLDNGRSGILAGETAEILGCIRWRRVPERVSVYKNIGVTRTATCIPARSARSVTPGIRGIEQAADLPGASSLCGACREVCPNSARHPADAAGAATLGRREDAAAAGAPPGSPRRSRGLPAGPPSIAAAMAAVRRVLRASATNGWITARPAWPPLDALPRSEGAGHATFQDQWRARAAARRSS